tara:strand:+ start:7923 stop:10067 length:2145 start_codon:yes stop_codon:yes gene_type:complete
MTLKMSLLFGSALAMLTAPAFAQTAGADEPSTAVGDVIVTGRYTIPDQIDTATGLGLTVRETPQSVTIITEQRILDQNLATVADVVNNAVGVSINEIDDVRNSFTARGFEITNYQVDGVPLAWTLAGGAGETIADVSLYERVEIVRGATGLLTGAGDPSASINLVRKHADRRDFGGYLNASYGSWNTYQVTADVAGAVTGDGAIRARAVARYEDGESYIDLYENQKLVLYGVVDADLGANTLLRVGASHQQGNPNAPAWGALPSFYSDGSFAAWPRSKTASADWTFWDTENQNVFANLEHRFDNGWTLTFDYNWLRNAQHTEILYLYGLVDTTTGDIQYSYPYSDKGESIQNSFSLKLQGELDLFGRSHDVVLGALHSTQDRDNTTYSALAFPPGTDFVNWNGAAYPYPGFSDVGFLAVEETVEQTGYYGSVRLNLTDELKVIGGGRLASWDLSGFNFGPVREYGDDNVFIPYLGALYDVTPIHRAYASYTEIFQPQNARDRDGDYLDPITGKAYEIGLKSAFLDEALQMTVALFRIEQDNLAQVDVGAFVPGTLPPEQAYLGAQGTVSKGFEIEVTGQPVEGWNISLGYSQFDAEDASGTAVSTDQPGQLLKLFTTYRLTGPLNDLVVGGGVNFRSKQYSEGLNPVTSAPFRFQQDAYTLVSLMARYDLTDSLQIQANADNLLDETYYSQIGFYSQYRYGAPRNYTVSLTYRF